MLLNIKLTFVASEIKHRLKVFDSIMTQGVKIDGILYFNVTKEMSGTN